MAWVTLPMNSHHLRMAPTPRVFRMPAPLLGGGVGRPGSRDSAEAHECLSSRVFGPFVQWVRQRRQCRPPISSLQKSRTHDSVCVCSSAMRGSPSSGPGTGCSWEAACVEWSLNSSLPSAVCVRSLSCLQADLFQELQGCSPVRGGDPICPDLSRFMYGCLFLGAKLQCWDSLKSGHHQTTLQDKMPEKYPDIWRGGSLEWTHGQFLRTVRISCLGGIVWVWFQVVVNPSHAKIQSLRRENILWRICAPDGHKSIGLTGRVPIQFSAPGFGVRRESQLLSDTFAALPSKTRHMPASNTAKDRNIQRNFQPMKFMQQCKSRGFATDSSNAPQHMKHALHMCQHIAVMLSLNLFWDHCYSKEEI